MAKERQSTSDMARVRLGALALVVSVFALVLAIMFFVAEDLVIMQIDFAGDEDTFGWVFVIISLGSAGIGLFLSLTMQGE